MTKRRTLALTVALLVCATPQLASAQGAEKVVVWHAYRGAEKRALEDYVEAHNEGTVGGVRIELVAQPADSYASKLTTAIPRDNGPDVFIFGQDRLGDWAETGIIAPIAPGARDPNQDFLPETLPPLRYKDDLWGLPMAFKSTVLFYNRAFIPEPPKTTGELLEMAKAHTRGDRVGLAYLYDDFYYHAAWYFGFGGELWDKGGRLAFDGEGSLASMDFVKSLQEAGVVPQEPSGALVAQLFNSGRAAMAIHGPWFLGEIDPSVEFGVAPLPMIDGVGKPARPFLTVEAAYVSARARDADKAQLVAYLLANLSAPQRALLGQQAVASKIAWEELSAYRNDPVMAVFRQQLSNTRPMGNQPRDRTIWEPALLMLRRAFRRGATPHEAARAGIRRHTAITRPAPPKSSPTAYIALALLVALAALLFFARSVMRIRGGREKRSAVRGWTWISPAVVGTTVLLFIPFIVGLTLALFSHRQGEWTFVGLANFADILGAQTFAATEPLSFYFALLVTILWTLVNVFLHVALGLALALVLARPALKLRPLYRVLLIVPWAVPSYITALIWKAMFSTQQGVINGFLNIFGVDNVAWFSSFPTAFFANVCANAWLGFPFMMVVCLGALQSIPKNLYEAADVDGASGWQKLRHITLPLLRPALAPAILIGTVWTFNQFNIVFLVSGGEPDNSTDILISEAYRWAFTRQEQYGYAAAYAALIFVILLGWSVFSARMGKRLEAAA